MVISSFLFALVALMLWTKTRPVSDARQNAAVPEIPGYTQKNVDIESDSIDGEKAKIRKAEEEKAAREAKIQAELDEMARKAREDEEARRRLLAPARAPAAASAPAAAIAETPEARAMRSNVLLPVTGSPSRGGNERGASSSGTSSPGGVNEEEQRRREVDARMRAVGVSSSSGSGSGSAGFASSDGESLGGRLKATNLPARAAGRLPNLDYLLKRGTAIPCGLKTGINTQLPGFVLCTVVNDVYSANGKTLLVERGATVFGEQQSALKKGQARTFAIWTRVDNPSGVSIEIDSPGTDAMGYSGIPGIVDGHFAERFGAAILLTLVKDFSRAAADRYSDGAGNINLGNSSDDVNSMAEEALKDSIGIPPNLVVKPGTVVHILVARDVSFESVYAIVN
ncbi:MAG: type IV secretion system protein VirB10 [Candidatus Accumulibacter sp.]|nr:type IV secretion system protein VirB10 [Accumulibacter sp.]